MERLNQADPGYRAGKQRSRISSQSRVSSFSFLLSRSTTFTERSMPWREQTSSAQTVGILGIAALSHPLQEGKQGHSCSIDVSRSLLLASLAKMIQTLLADISISSSATEKA